MRKRSQASGNPFGPDFATYYDLLYSDKDYIGECRLIDRVLRAGLPGPRRRLLDLGCGTGGHAVPLSRQGYQVVGVDRMPAMLRIAERKAAKAGRPIVFRRQDLRTLDLGMVFDSAIAMFAVLSFQIENEDLISTLNSVRRHLRAGGLFVFDVWHAPAVLSEGREKRLKVVEREGLCLLRYATPETDAVRQVTSTHHHLVVLRRKDRRILAEVKESQAVRMFFVKELAYYLETSGFKALRFFDFPHIERPVSDQSWNLGVVAKAID